MTEEEIEDAAWKSIRFGEGDHIRDMPRMLSFVDGFIAGDSHGYQRARVEWLECLAESRQGYEQRIAELETAVKDLSSALKEIAYHSDHVFPLTNHAKTIESVQHIVTTKFE
jgi:hypothetical protein